MKRFGHPCKKSPIKSDIYGKWDFSCELPFKVDVKTSRRFNKEDIDPNDAYVVLEIKNVKGNEGSLYGQAQFFAYEIGNYFYLVSTKALRLWVSIMVDMDDYVSSVREAYKKVYTRNGRDDLMTIIPLQLAKDMASFSCLKDMHEVKT